MIRGNVFMAKDNVSIDKGNVFPAKDNVRIARDNVFETYHKLRISNNKIRPTELMDFHVGTPIYRVQTSQGISHVPVKRKLKTGKTGDKKKPGGPVVQV